MALPNPPIDSGIPIPNNPFYYPPTNALQSGEGGIVIVGDGLTVSPTGTISATGTGGVAVTSLTAGPGIYVSQPDGNVTLVNTGVISLSAGPGISVSGSGGVFTITNTAPASSPTGTVTGINTGAGLTGGPITTTGTIQLASSGVAPGTYPNATITVDQYGRVTLASPGLSAGIPFTASAPLVVTSTFPQALSINSASTTSTGVVKLNTSTSSTSTTEAATPSAVKTAVDLGTSAAADAASALSTAISAATAASSAQTSANTALSTATTAQTSANTAQTTANTALAAAQAAQAAADDAVPISAYVTRGQLLAGDGLGSYLPVPAGADGKVLGACSACSSGLYWRDPLCAPATPTTFGALIGYTDSVNVNFSVSLGCEALKQAPYVGLKNVAIGYSAGCSIGTGECNILIGADSGCNYTTEKGNVILGSYYGDVGKDDNIILSTGGGTVRLQIDNGGALSMDGSSYGSVGQVLTSQGTGSSPTWASTVTAITAGTGLTGGTITTSITTSGTIALADTTVAPGSYTYGSFTVDQQGRLTAASSGTPAVTAVTGTSPISVTSGTTPVVSIASASVTSSGAVQLYDGLDSTSTSLALTAAQGKILQDQISSVSAPAATPTTLGTVLGCTTLNGTALGCGVGIGTANTSIGNCALCNAVTNTQYNTAVGALAGCSLGSGCGNIFLGNRAGNNLTGGCCNVALGPYTTFSNAMGECQLVIGWNSACYWMRGDCNKNICFGGGVIDCAGSLGNAGETLTATGSNSVVWATPTQIFGKFIESSNCVLVGTSASIVNWNCTLRSSLVQLAGSGWVQVTCAGEYAINLQMQLATPDPLGLFYRTWIVTSPGTILSCSLTDTTMVEQQGSALSYQTVALSAGQCFQVIQRSSGSQTCLSRCCESYGGSFVCQPTALLQVALV